MDRVVYKNYYIDKTKTGYRVSSIQSSKRHTHLRHRNACYKLINNVVAKKIPRRCSCYYLESHARLSNDEEYTRKIREYIEVKQNKSKKQNYYNPHKKHF